MSNLLYAKSWRLSNRQGALSGGGGYLLYDDFSVDVAAGAVNGTFPKVGGARVVTDTNSKISIGSYFLFDSFSVPIAAGSVNGTPANFGGARVVVDTNAKVSVI